MVVRRNRTWKILAILMAPSALLCAQEPGNLFEVGSSVWRLTPGLAAWAEAAEPAAGTAPADTATADTATADTATADTETAGESQGEDSTDSFPTLELSAGGGWQYGGEIEIDGIPVDLDAHGGAYAKLALDLFPVRFLGLGLFGSYSQADLSDSLITVNTDIDMWEIGAALKGRIPLSKHFFITPGVSLSYRRTVVNLPVIANESIDGLGVNFGVDFRVRFGVLEIWVEPGFLTQPYGALVEDGTEVTFGPIAYLVAGLAIDL